MDLTGKAAQALARRSSRRQFVKFLAAGSLGTGLFLTRTGVSLGAITGCVGCGGGPCNDCWSPAPLCNGPPAAGSVQDLSRGRRLSGGLHNLGGMVLLPLARP